MDYGNQGYPYDYGKPMKATSGDQAPGAAFDADSGMTYDGYLGDGKLLGI